ncbi:hypothetical protein BASA81_004240, partial [Batrachochytrium salamandrivorans]
MLALVAGLVLAYMAYSRLSRKRPYSGDLTKQRVVILGASSGIGKDLAIQYASRGAQLLLLARRRDQLEDVQSACRAMHAATTCEIVIGDITNEIVLSQVVQATTAVLGGIDVLVLCAGITSVRPFGSLCELDTIQSKRHATRNKYLIITDPASIRYKHFRASAVDSDVPGTATHSAIAKVADQKRRGGISSEACAAYMIRAADRGDRLV